MHWAWNVSKGLDPAKVPVDPAINIQWTLQGAKEMVQGYGIVYQPALSSRHTEGRAVDMRISWEGDLSLPGGVIASEPRDGSKNTDLHAAAKARYSVIKLLSDPPHWSEDGR